MILILLFLCNINSISSQLIYEGKQTQIYTLDNPELCCIDATRLEATTNRIPIVCSAA